MIRLPKVGWLLLAAGFLSLPSQAQAQFFAYPNYGPYLGGGYGFGGWGYGGYGYGGWSYGGWGGWGGRGWGYGGLGYMGGYGAPLSYNTAWSFPVRQYAERPTADGVAVYTTSQPRMRETLYPAISAWPQTVIEAPRGQHFEGRACIAMQLPCASAQVYLDGAPTTQLGLQRRFVTPALNPASRYSFDVEVRWQDDAGQSRMAKRKINVRAGETTPVDFRRE